MISWQPRELEKSPFFAAVAPLLARLPAGRFPELFELNALLRPAVVSGGGVQIRFVEPGPEDRAFEAHYEVRAFREGAVATRAGNAHDLFNALAWMTFPRAKAAINSGHYARLLARGGAGGPRGAARDALTLFDESGVIVVSAAPELLDLLRGFQWKRLFWERRAEVIAAMRVYVIGHAIMEKAIAPYAGLAAKAVLFEVGADFLAASPEAQLAQLDAPAAARLAELAESGSARDFAPLPLLGLPGWCADNANAGYYDNAAHFRPGRGRSAPVPA